MQTIYRAILPGLMILVILVVLPHPFATNDGPVHLAFSHLILTLHQNDFPLQHLAYLVQLKPNPNLAVYLLMAALMRIFTPAVTESLIQLCCLIAPMLAAYFAIGRINPRNVWLSVFVLPISLSQMFFLGLYNHCISTAAFFLVIGTYFWMCKSPSWLRALALSGTLLLAFMCHASGFIMSVAAVGSLSIAAGVLSLRRSGNLLATVREQRYALGALLVLSPLAGWFLSAGAKSVTTYDVSLHSRLWQFSRFEELAANYPLIDRFAAAGVSWLLLGGLVVVSARLLRNSSKLSAQRRDQALGVLAGTAAAIVIMLAFPDRMGGGWTHFRRFEIFPFFWILLVLAFESFSARFMAIFVAGGTSAALFLLTSAVVRQRAVREQIAPLAVADRLIGNHCTVLPIVLEPRPVGVYKNRIWMVYEPFYEAASRLELTRDRVVLFNYLARLDAYPVHFRPEIEPQKVIFHWQPQQEEVRLEKVDVPAFEQASGLDVDYIIVWGGFQRARPGMKDQVHAALSGYGSLYSSPDGLFTLYRRQSVHNSYCSEPPVGAATATAN
jgi:hypothetical protein